MTLLPREVKQAAEDIGRAARQVQSTLAAVQRFIERCDRIADKLERGIDAVVAAGDELEQS